MSPLSMFRCAIAVTAMVSAAAFGAPTAVAPSVARVGHETTVQGAGFVSGQVITLRITDPAGTVSKSAVVVGADGTIVHAITPTQSGRYRVELLDAGNHKVGNVAFISAGQ